MKLVYGIVASIFAFLSCPAFAEIAQNNAPELFTRVDRYSSSYVINDDGSFTETREIAITVLKEQAIEAVKQSSVTYSTSVQKAEVIEAYTKKVDGHRIDSSKSNFQIESNTGNGKDGPVFSDLTTLTVVFPDVQVGDTVVFSYRLIASEPMFPKQFSTLEYFPRTTEYDDVHIKIDAPSSLWTQYTTRNLKEVTNTENGGRKLIEWVYANPHPIKSKRRNFSVYDQEKEPGFEFTTFKSFGEIAEAYGLRARPKAAVTERISKLANDITINSKTPHEIARALYDWVAVNITYAGNCIGLGAVVPHGTEFILDNRMGDCKDHATLLQALLAAKKIESTQVLINAGSSYRLPSVPVVSMANHVINYIPSLALYVDSTSNSTPFGMLPYTDQDKPVLHVDGYRDGAKTSVVSPGTNQQLMKTTVNIQPDGSVKGEVKVTLKGMFAVTAREQMRKLKKEDQDDLVKNMYKAMGYFGNGTFEKDDPKELLDTYRFEANFEVKNLYQYPGTGAFRIGPFIYNEAPIAAFISGALQQDDDLEEGSCSNGESVEEYVFVFPKRIKILSIPDDLKVANGFVSYEAHYHKKNNVITVRRALDDKTHGNICSHQYTEEFRAFAQKVLPNLNAQVIYK